MLCTIEFDRNFLFAIPHVETRERVVEAVQHSDLRLGLRQTRAHEQEPRPGFLGRFRPGVHQPDNLAQLHQAPHAWVALRQSFDVDRPQVSCICQGINANQRRQQLFSTTEVEGRPNRRGDRYPANRRELVVAQLVAMDDDTVGGLTVSPVHLRGKLWIDPFRTMQRSSRQPREDSLASRPEPRGDTATGSGQFVSRGHVHIAVYRAVSSAQRVPAHPPVGQRFGADEGPITVVHALTVADASDTPPSSGQLWRQIGKISYITGHSAR